MATKKRLVVGNWKMNGTRASAAALASALDRPLRAVDADVALCAPFLLLDHVGALLKRTSLQFGAQDVSDAEEGAYTFVQRSVGFRNALDCTERPSRGCGRAYVRASATDSEHAAVAGDVRRPVRDRDEPADLVARGCPRVLHHAQACTSW